eukprot:4980814-Amphidinium_carterae.1
MARSLILGGIQGEKLHKGATLVLVACAIQTKKKSCQAISPPPPVLHIPQIQISRTNKAWIE